MECRDTEYHLIIRDFEKVSENMLKIEIEIITTIALANIKLRYDFFYCISSADRHATHVMESSYYRLWVFVTPKVLAICCRSLNRDWNLATTSHTIWPEHKSIILWRHNLFLVVFKFNVHGIFRIL